VCRSKNIFFQFRISELPGNKINGMGYVLCKLVFVVTGATNHIFKTETCRKYAWISDSIIFRATVISQTSHLEHIEVQLRHNVNRLHILLLPVLYSRPHFDNLNICLRS
jgi:hypothetical protein